MGQTSIRLYSGEGVYSNVGGSFSIPTTVGNIKYAGLTGSVPVSSGSISSGALLTYNINTNIKDSSGEQGTITGVASIVPSMSRGTVELPLNGPFPIGAGDMLRHKGKDGGYQDGISLKLPEYAFTGIILDE